jgi:chromosome segregation ATPase
MPSKSELQTILKEKYGVNKNISQSLSLEDCERLLAVLKSQPSTVKLIESFASKNSDLSQNNRHYGQLRSQAEKKLKFLQSEYAQLEKSIADLEQSKGVLDVRKHQLSQEHQALETQISELSTRNQALTSKVQTLTTQNDELTEANEKLKKDNKDLKNIVDQIRLRLARDTKMLLQYEDSEIRKAMIRLFRWTLG